jgi:phosphoribosylformimino-5-aminoimidazole carboxamide ribonucleotide (ProFAR) isomerase
MEKMELPVAYGGGVPYNKDVRRCKKTSLQQEEKIK